MGENLYVNGAIWLLVVWLLIGIWRIRRRLVRPGPALLESMELLHTDAERAAIKLIQEEKTGYRDPESKDGDLPQLEPPAR